MGNCLKSPTTDDISLLHDSQSDRASFGDGTDPDLEPPPPYEVRRCQHLPVFWACENGFAAKKIRYLSPDVNVQYALCLYQTVASLPTPPHVCLESISVSTRVNNKLLESFPKRTGSSRMSGPDSSRVCLQSGPVQSLTGSTEVCGAFGLHRAVCFCVFLCVCVCVTRSRLTCPCTTPHPARPGWPPS